MKNFILVLLVAILTSCTYREVPVELRNRKVLYISSVYKDYYGGGKFPRKFTHKYVVSSSPRGIDTVMTLEYDVANEQVPFKFNLGDTLHLDFKP